jgi:hypothetical protein
MSLHPGRIGDASQKIVYIPAEALPSPLPVKIVAFLLAAVAIFGMFSGRGTLALLQGFLCILVAIESFWGAVQYNRIILQRLLTFFVIVFIAAVVIGVFDYILIDEYCATATFEEKESCQNVAWMFAVVQLLFGVVLGPIFMLTVGIFYRRLSNIMSHAAEGGAAVRVVHRNRRNGGFFGFGGAGEMTEATLIT